MNQTLSRTFGLALIVIAVALGIFGLPLAQQPPRFEASALVKVERDSVDLPELNQVAGLTAQAAAEADSTFFIQTEIALLQSEATLNRVITNLDLNHAWAKRLNDGQSLKISETLQILKGRLHAQPGPEVTLITIKAVSEIPAEAAEMANAAARAYCDYRADYRRRLTQNALDAVAGKFSEMQNKIVLAREKLQQAGQKLDPALLAQAAAGPPAPESETLRAARARFSESVLRYLAKSNQLAHYQSKAANEDENVAQLKASAEKAKSEMLAVEAATRNELGRHELLQSYNAARLELEEVNQLFAPLKKTVESLQNDLRPKEPAPAQIVEQASPPTVPDAREVERGRVFLGCGGLALALGVGLLWIARKPRSSRA